MTVAVPRYRTALSRNRLSRPLGQAVGDGLLSEERTVFDYGCGRGDDLRHLAAMGIAAEGWDPTHRPAGERRPADVVNLGYVVNVIEGREERAETLRRAWTLAQRVLVVAARLVWDQKELSGRPLGDGVLTRTGTFQKFFEQAELSAWIEQVLEVSPVAAAPGIFYVFRHPSEAQQFLANRVASYQPRVRIDPHAVYEVHRVTLAPLVDFMTDHGRPPRDDEFDADITSNIRQAVGSMARGYRLIRQVTGDVPWTQAAAARQADLLVYIGLSRFGRRPQVGQLPMTLVRDIKAHFGSYQGACAKADRLLYASGQTALLPLVARKAVVGKLTPAALYVHRTALGALAPVLRLYEGCAQVLSGTVGMANVIKLSMTEPQISYLVYPRFDREAHPALDAAVTVNLRRLSVDFRDYSRVDNPPILHRKEELVGSDYPHRDLWRRLTAAEIRAGLYTETAHIGTLRGWEERLRQSGVELQGHRLQPVTNRTKS
jgi:DNA phosphorothioation-associated putative methyltransferase